MATTNHERVGKALELLKAGFGPFVWTGQRASIFAGRRGRDRRVRGPTQSCKTARFPRGGRVGHGCAGAAITRETDVGENVGGGPGNERADGEGASDVADAGGPVRRRVGVGRGAAVVVVHLTFDILRSLDPARRRSVTAGIGIKPTWNRRTGRAVLWLAKRGVQRGKLAIFILERLGWKYRGKIESEGSRASAPKSDHQAGEPFAGESNEIILRGEDR